MQLDINQLCQLLTVLDSTGVSELSLKSADFELTVRKGSITSEPVVALTSTTHLPNATADLGIGAVGGGPAPAIPLTAGGETATRVTPTAAPPVPSPMERKWVEVTSPMVGTFYRAPAPGERPFVEVGDRVSPRQTVCIIEAMKLMNEIEAEVSGTVVEILVQNGEPIEFGQALMRINPD